MAERFIAIAGQFNGTVDSPRKDWSWDGRVHDQRADAITAGFAAFGCDDFNVGVLGTNGRLVRIDWMDEKVDDDPVVLAEVDAYLDLPRRTSTCPKGKR